MKQGMKEPYEKGVAIRSAPSLALLPRGTQRSVDRGIGGVGYGASKRCNPDADVFVMRGRPHERGRLARVPAQSGVVEDPRHA